MNRAAMITALGLIAALACVPKARGILHADCGEGGTCTEGTCVTWRSAHGTSQTCEIPCDYERNHNADCPEGFVCRTGVDVSGPYTCVARDRIEEQRERFMRRLDAGAD